MAHPLVIGSRSRFRIHFAREGLDFGVLDSEKVATQKFCSALCTWSLLASSKLEAMWEGMKARALPLHHVVTICQRMKGVIACRTW